MEVFERWHEDSSQIFPFDVFEIGVYKLYRGKEDIGFEDHRNSSYMNKYRLEDLKDAEVFEGVVL
jgi:hypothetical protein